MTDPFFSADALAALDKLWAIPDLTLKDVQKRMQQRFGLKFTGEQLRNAARRNDVAEVTIGPAISIDTVRARPAVKRPVDNVRLVQPGSCPVPKGGYKLGMSRNG